MAEGDQGQKTEQPTHKKLTDARKKGQAPSIPELRHATMFVGAMIVAGGMGAWTLARLGTLFVTLWSRADDYRLDPAGARDLTIGIARHFVVATAPLAALLFALALLPLFLQGRPSLNWHRVAPNWSKLSPAAGAAKLFGKPALVEFAKTLAKFAAIAILATLTIRPHLVALDQLAGMSPAGIGQTAATLVFRLVRAIGLMVALLAAVDFVYQHRAFIKRLMMTHQEVRDEHRQSDGDPAIKARLRSIRIGMVVTLLCVFGGFLIAGGNLSVIAEALPHEILTIAGAAIGAFILGNSVPVVKRALAGVAHIFRGPRWNEGDYRDLLALLFALLTTFRNGGGMAIEKHIDAPEESALFMPYPRLCADTALIHFICDYLRMMTVNLEDPYQIAEAMENDIERHHAEVMVPQHAIQLMADGLPALGIVAAVLGVINTMGSIDQPTQILGAMIGSALVGTFLGVLLAYGFVGPIASKLQQTLDAEQKPYTLVKTAIVAYAQRMPVQVAIELARRMTPSGYAPSFGELEQALDVARDELVATQAKAA